MEKLPSSEAKYSNVQVLYTHMNIEVVGAIRSKKEIVVKNIPFEQIIKYYKDCKHISDEYIV